MPARWLEGEAAQRASVHDCQYHCRYMRPRIIATDIPGLLQLPALCTHDHEHEILQGKVHVTLSDGLIRTSGRQAWRADPRPASAEAGLRSCGRSRPPLRCCMAIRVDPLTGRASWHGPSGPSSRGPRLDPAALLLLQPPLLLQQPPLLQSQWRSCCGRS